LGGRQLRAQPINETTSVSAENSSLFLGYGDVRVTTSGSSELYEKLFSVKKFMSAIEAEKNRPAKEAQEQEKQPQHEQYSPSGYICEIPMPSQITWDLLKQTTKNRFNKWAVDVLTPVKKGDILITFGKVNTYNLNNGLAGAVVAPFDGKILSFNEDPNYDQPLVKMEIGEIPETVMYINTSLHQLLDLAQSGAMTSEESACAREDLNNAKFKFYPAP